MKEIKASVYLKRRFRKAKQNPGNASLTLNAFARKLASEGDTLAAAWFEHKKASWNHEAKAARIKNKGGRIALERAATKMARRKKSERSRNKSASTDTAKTVETKKA